MKLKLGADLSVYQGSLTKELFKQLIDNGMRFVIFKVQGVKPGTSILAEDSRAETYKEWCLEFNLPYGIYVYTYPGISIQSQIDFTKRLQQKYEPQVTFVDAEEYLNYSTNLPYASSYLNNFYKKYYDSLEGVKGIYTGDWFIDRYCPEMLNWLPGVQYLWWAWYYRYYLSWKLFMVTLGGEPISITKLPNVVTWLENKSPGTKGLRWDIWQFESLMKVKELGNVSSDLFHFDWNVMPEDSELFRNTPVPSDKEARLEELDWMAVYIAKRKAELA